jgi:hypothetical protein
MFFDGPYLRVLTPETIDGINVKMMNDRVVFKESHLPLTAKKHLKNTTMRFRTYCKGGCGGTKKPKPKR